MERGGTVEKWMLNSVRRCGAAIACVRQQVLCIAIVIATGTMAVDAMAHIDARNDMGWQTWSTPTVLPRPSHVRATSAAAAPRGRTTVQVHPGDDLQRLAATHPPRTIFHIAKGVHRLQQITPQNGQQFIGEPGAVLSGAKLLTEFVKDGSYWVAEGQTQEGMVRGRCEPRRGVGVPSETCMFPEDLFVDDQLFAQVSRLEKLSSKQWFFDYAADKIYLADNPVGRTVETSVAPRAFEGQASRVVIRGLVIEKYATPAQEGAIHARVGHQGPLAKQWIVEDNVVRWNHAIGIRAGRGMKVIGNDVHHNGQYGVAGSGADILIQGNEIAHNNTMGFHWHTAGGTKFVWTKRLVVKDNHVHHNRGPGLWTDINNIHTLYEHNVVQHNGSVGIFHEISYAAVIRDNLVEHNGHGDATWLSGAGILVSSSSDVEVYGNRVLNNGDGIGAIQTPRGKGRYGPYEVRNLHVHHNEIVMEQGETGLAVKSHAPEFFLRKNNRFTHNTYRVRADHTKCFRWMNQMQTFEQWQQFGQDLQGAFARLSGDG